MSSLSQLHTDLHAEGKSDGALGYSPRCKNPVYLDGWLEGLRESIIKSPQTVKITWLEPNANPFGFHDCDWLEG
jgi:hypothetical protein